MRRLLGALVATMVLTACPSGLPRPVAALFEKGDAITFSHSKHAAAEVDCLTCHETVFDAPDLETRLLPPEKTCLGCHSEWKEQQQCAKCHAHVENAQHWPEPASPLVFSHAAHMERVEEDCKRCHTSLPEPRAPAKKPTMASCLTCHGHKQDYAVGRCETCHKDLSAEKLRPIASFEHAGNFVKTHKLVARSSSQECFKCHDQNFCLDCHTATPGILPEMKKLERVETQFIHRGDFVSRHALEAAADPALCSRCHGTSACMQCHTSNNVSPAGTDPRSPHPRGWSLSGSSQFHGTQARVDIMSCAACHDQGAASVCINCHKVGGVGGNPHPPTWNALHSTAEISRNSMCQYCHQ